MNLEKYPVSSKGIYCVIIFLLVKGLVIEKVKTERQKILHRRNLQNLSFGAYTEYSDRASLCAFVF